VVRDGGLAVGHFEAILGGVLGNIGDLEVLGRGSKRWRRQAGRGCCGMGTKRGVELEVGSAGADLEPLLLLSTYRKERW